MNKAKRSKKSKKSKKSTRCPKLVNGKRLVPQLNRYVTHILHRMDLSIKVIKKQEEQIEKLKWRLNDTSRDVMEMNNWLVDNF